ncbi:hypothetical protein [Acetobacter lambici]|uniref:Uncharacterized protein n=1 Tax=Acetobacter lambici TaxID=1332824 RepID=A0ABT1F2Q8_9PROT|nr:hypothetical protein [Acetobacter lambici]MCP1243009.1 hypothetical protein [Acetobacter lambici]MCP1258519.1 hypothetical protein [Acetobacter lambici]
MSYKNEAYEKALNEGMFSTEGLTPFVAIEVQKYETAIVNLLRVADAMQFPFFTDNRFAAVELAFAEEAIGDMVCAVRELHEKNRIERGLVAQTRHDAMRGLEVAA